MAGERPVLPEPGPDSKLTGGKTPADFFGARLENQECQTKLKSVRDELVTSEGAVKRLVAEKAQAYLIERAEKVVAGSREAYLDGLEICGPCATREIERRKIISLTKTEMWNISDGSCYLDPKKFGKPAYERMVKFLSHVDNYAAYRTNGLRNILEFVALDSTSGEVHPEWTTFDKPFYVFISVLGPSFLGETMSPQYVILNEVKEKTEADLSRWSLSFRGVTAPRGFRVPDVYQYSASGRKSIVRSLKLPSVLGQWHVDTAGNLRYYTAADFGALGIASGFTSKLARHVILETIAHLYEAGAGEKP